MRTSKRWGYLALLALLMGCQGEDQLPVVRYGEDKCAFCGMIINEAPSACAIETQEGEIRKYDDFNCMFLDSERIQPKRYWVHDHDKPDQWLDGTQAYYVQADDFQTPMGSRLLAVATRETADQKARQLKGTVLRFEEARQVFVKKDSSPK